ncbi:MAG: GNVR domain-containing protein, partial [Alistipes sp.]|nr:GNVR domain-containing protein [Alistipes sp.]
SSVISAPMKFLGWTMSRFMEEESSNTLNPAALTKEQSEVIRCLNDWIAVSVDKKTGVITASTTAQDPVIAATVADSLVNKLQEYIYTYRTEKAVRDLKFTQELYNEAKEKYYEAQRRYAYASDANTYVAKKAAAVELVRLQNEQQLTFSIYNQMAQQLEQAKVKVQEQTPCVTIIEPASVPVKKSNASKVMILGAFIFLGGCFGAGKVVVREIFMKKEEERG